MLWTGNSGCFPRGNILYVCALYNLVNLLTVISTKEFVWPCSHQELTIIQQGAIGAAYVTGSDKPVTKCQFGHSELLPPTESAIRERQSDIMNNAKSEVMSP